MKKFILGSLMALTVSPLATATERLRSQMIEMSDGVHLATDIYYQGDLTTPRPTVLVRTVYNKNDAFVWDATWKTLVESGYAVVIQDIRGRYESEGIYKVGHNRRNDGEDTLDWITNQAWSNGKVGLSGCSYLGETQVILSATNHPALVAAQPQAPASGYYRPGRAWQSFSGGVFELGQTAGWFAGSGSSEFNTPDLTGKARSDYFNSKVGKSQTLLKEYPFEEYLKNINTLPILTLLERSKTHPNEFHLWRGSEPDGEYFRSMDFVTKNDAVSIPHLFFDNWYDYGARETLMMAEQFRKTGKTKAAQQHQYVVIGPGTHCNFAEQDKDVSVGDRPVSNATFAYQQAQLDWFNYWLKDEKNGSLDRPFLTYFVLGENKWKTADQWPLANTDYQKWYLTNQSNANSKNGGGLLQVAPPNTEKLDSFVYNPANPVPSLGGHTCCTGTDTEAGGYDQSAIEQREDVLVYTSATLQQGIEVTGEIKAKLFVRSSARDTDFMVKLVDVYPDGSAYNVQEGAIRMRYKDSLRKATLIKLGKVYEVEIDLNASSNYFAKGHKIRIEITSSNFPRLERNLNTGENNALGTKFIKANNEVLHGGKYLSYIQLPVIPR
ncbi:CocE/NonD family hydrolase [Thalassotalea agarivorans]|uniref:Xaa-Pro dipeptidyl-peptidase C-terminal domain-containing protein n=1 Tax=Thalassotalea agarivorans TaxID=349064 RepID=A0A1I0DND7_THASX|nr:CocE/NonD family hydrolase [Thalassotalea agarivorans]SET34024.1 hypothetical protein SAMN05660429_01594 [Thalassotalea agarivorans]